MFNICIGVVCSTTYNIVFLNQFDWIGLMSTRYTAIQPNVAFEKTYCQK